MDGPNHFEGKSVNEHLLAARKKGSSASSECHGTEMPGHKAAAIDAAKETAVFLLAFWMILSHFSVGNSLIFTALFAISITYFFWKMGRSALLGFSRLERLHRLIEEERWEIEHNRAQEKEELTAMYAQKGLSGKLLEDVIEVLMADDQRLLQLMLTEELGLSLESFEHPIKQSFGAGIGVLIAACGTIASLYFGNFLMGIAFGAILLILAAALRAKLEKNRLLTSCVWNFSTSFLTLGILHFILKLL
ncbi:MAG: VIT1/CCC1 transporter family protein [Simkaniaceae bacterium]|nr:VIT1/CCC1 transporter family protein [Simkaniaceae bacterium]